METVGPTLRGRVPPSAVRLARDNPVSRPPDLTAHLWDGIDNRRGEPSMRAVTRALSDPTGMPAVWGRIRTVL